MRAACLAPTVLVVVSCASLRPAGPELRDLRLGDYSLVMEATAGPRTGQLVKGLLSLRGLRVGATWDDLEANLRSWDTEPHFVYGWIDELDFGPVSASIFDGEGTKPDSRDPLSPGVVLHRASLYGDNDAVPTLIVGSEADGWQHTAAHLVAPADLPPVPQVITVKLDAAGIGLWVLRLEKGESLRGRWREWGALRSGRGTFCLCPL